MLITHNCMSRKEYYRKNLLSISEIYNAYENMDVNLKHFTESMVDELVLIPTLMLFVSWVLSNSINDNVKTLFFLSRDAYPAYIVGKRLCEAYHIDIECRYLYCSRLSLREPMYSENMADMLDKVCCRGIDLNLKKILTRAGLTEDQITELDYDNSDLNEIIPYTEIKNIRSMLENNKKFMELVENNSRQKWELLKQYFQQEGLTTEKTVGIVDSGWIGSTQKTISEIRRRMGCLAPIFGYYMGLFEIPKEMDKNYYRSLFFEPKKGLLNKICFSNSLFEVIFSSDGGTTIEYEHRNNRVEPVVRTYNPNYEIINVFNEKVRKCGDNFTSINSKAEWENMPVNKAKKIISKSLRKFMWSPTSEEADFYGTLKFSDDILDTDIRDIAPIFSLEEIKTNHFFYKMICFLGMKNNMYRESAWFAATVKRSTERGTYHCLSNSLYKAVSYLIK